MLRFLLVLVTVFGCGDARVPGQGATSGKDPDSAFSQVQARGHTAMGVDQYTSSHVFEPLPDGGRISLQRDHNDSAGVEQIRTHMRFIADAFGRGDFALPGFVHDRDVPGTRVMSERKTRIRYTADTLAGGGQVRLQSSDTTAIRAIHDFLAFQRHDHRSQ